jgi:hypothetical protein
VCECVVERAYSVQSSEIVVAVAFWLLNKYSAPTNNTAIFLQPYFLYIGQQLPWSPTWRQVWPTTAPNSNFETDWEIMVQKW